MTVGQAIQAVQSLYSKGVQSQDSRLRPRHIWNQLLRSRAKILVQRYNKGQELSQWEYMTIPCLKLVQATPYECSCIGLTNCTVLRSEFPIPKIIEGIDSPIIQMVSSVDGTMKFDCTTFSTNKYNKGNKFTATKPQYYLFNNYLYITVVKQIKMIQVTAAFNDPFEVWQYPSACGPTDCCFNLYDKTFPLLDDPMDMAVDMATQKLIGVFVQMQEDRNNDANDNSGQQNILHQPQDNG